MTSSKFLHVKVTLTGEDGNAFSIIGRVKRALRDGGASSAECTEFVDEATSSDYDNVIATAMKWVDVE